MHFLQFKMQQWPEMTLLLNLISIIVWLIIMLWENPINTAKECEKLWSECILNVCNSASECFSASQGCSLCAKCYLLLIGVVAQLAVGHQTIYPETDSRGVLQMGLRNRIMPLSLSCCWASNMFRSFLIINYLIQSNVWLCLWCSLSRGLRDLDISPFLCFVPWPRRAMALRCSLGNLFLWSTKVLKLVWASSTFKSQSQYVLCCLWSWFTWI